MFFLRPSREDDLAVLMRLAGMTGAGFTSLSPDQGLLRDRLALSAASFAGTVRRPQEAHYLFALEDSTSGRVVGVCGILAAAGQRNPFYSYRVGLEVNAAKALDIVNAQQTLYLCSDYTGCAEIGSLFLDPDYRHRRVGRLLSRARFLFMAEFRALFPVKVIAEMRGVSDDNGYSPFWESLGKHFLSMSFTQADYLSGREDNSFIAELMPRHPIYVTLLSEQARASLGEVHRDTRTARRILESEGFRYQSYVDIFDAGPTLESRVDDVHSVRASRRLVARVVPALPGAAQAWLMASTSRSAFRCAIVQAAVDDESGSAAIDAEALAVLELADGDPVRACPL